MNKSNIGRTKIKLQIIGDRLKEIRCSRGFTQQEFADFLEIHRVTLAKLESSESLPTIINLVIIAEKCNISLDWLCNVNLDK